MLLNAMTSCWMKLSFLIVISVFISCSNKDQVTINSKPQESQRLSMKVRCECPLDNIVGGNYFIAGKSNTGDKSFKEVNGNLSANKMIKKLIDAGIEAAYKKEKTNIDTKIIIQEIVDKYPKITNYALIKKDALCASIRNACQDVTLSDKEIIEFKALKISELENIIDQLILKDLSFVKEKPVKQKTKSAKPKLYKVSLKVEVDEPEYKHANITLHRNGKKIKDLVPTEELFTTYYIEEELKSGKYILQWEQTNTCGAFTQSLKIDKNITNTIFYICD